MKLFFNKKEPIAFREKFAEIVDKLTGRVEHFGELYRAAFSETEAANLTKKSKKENRTIAFMILLIIVVVIFSTLLDESGSQNIWPDLMRPSAGDPPKTAELEVSAEYEGYSASKRASLRILPRQQSHEENMESLKELERRLPSIILGENHSLDDVTKDLSLPREDLKTGAEFSWRSSDPRTISNEGVVNIVGIKEGTTVSLTAHIRLDSAYETMHIGVVTGKSIPAESIGSALQGRLLEAISETSNTRDGESVSLPDEIEGGIKLEWAQPESNDSLPVLFICVFVALFCFSQRYKRATQTIEKARAEIERDFPDFIQKLGLLLGAGMVITSAISRISEDYLSTREQNGKRRLYEEVSQAFDRMRASGTPLVYEFSELARRSGLRELMRFSTTLADNIDKGSKLADKLRIEAELLWESRKKHAEKEGRVAETKLIFPMVLQIFVVIAITVMPAAFEMS